ncbi:MAG: class I SAM-dependent methyltransferase [Promethearchaeota archaeon]
MVLPGLDSPRVRNAVHRILNPRGALAHYLWESIPIYGHYFGEITFRPNMRILDVGCGVGRTTLELAYRSPKGKIVGIDINPALTACANQLAQLFEIGDRIRFFAGDIVEKATIPKGETFDLIYTRHVLADLKQEGLKELARHLTPDGLLVAVEPDYSMTRAYGLPHLDSQFRREGEVTFESGLNGGNLRCLLQEARLKVTLFEPRYHIFTEKDNKWLTFAKKRLATVYEEEIPKVEALRFRRGNQWVDDRITRLRNQITELGHLTRRHTFTHIFIQFLTQATKK